MPIKRRTTKRKYQKSIDVLNAMTDGDMWEDFWGGPSEGRHAWEALRDQLRTNFGTRPAPFWLYEPDVPVSLRRLADVYAVVEDPALEEQGLRWLLASDHLRDGETKVIVRGLELLEAERAERITAATEFSRDFTELAEDEE